jgi:aminopeptidase N
MPVVSYILPENRDAVVARLGAIPKHLATLASLFDEYPFADTKYGIVASHFSGGMEHPTLTSIGANLLASSGRDLSTLLVHELSHQWWGDTVTMRAWDDIWLNEGFATYSEVLYAERADGADPGALMRARDDGRYDGFMARPIVADPADPFRYTGAVYQKGAWVLHMLRHDVGDETFFALLREWRRRHSWGTVTRGELRGLCEETAGRDFKQFFDQWVETPYRPILRLSWRTSADASQISLSIAQMQGHSVVHPQPGPGDTRYYRFPLPVRLAAAGGRTVDVTIPVSGRAAVEVFGFSNPLGAPITSLTVDPNNVLLKVVESVGPY